MATAVGTYATLSAVKTRANITNNTDDTLLQTFCDAANMYIETTTGRVLAPIASTTYTYDGSDALENGRCLLIPRGIQTVSQLQVAQYTGGTLITVPSTDYFLRPTAQERQPGWPATELWMTDIPSASSQAPVFYAGMNNVAVTGTFGWPAIPDDISELAVTVVIRAWRGRMDGQQDILGSDEFGRPVISRYLSARDRDTLSRYTIRAVPIV